MKSSLPKVSEIVIFAFTVALFFMHSYTVQSQERKTIINRIDLSKSKIEELRLLNSKYQLSDNRKTQFSTKSRAVVLKGENSEPKLKSAQIVSKTVDVTAGNLASKLTATEKTTVTNLTITGSIDARDFKTMRDDMSALAVIDLNGVKIAAYTGTLGTAGTTSRTYPANYIPVSAFNDSPSFKFRDRLTKVTLPTSLVGIDKYAFFNCLHLTGALTIPNSVTTIAESAFAYCYGFTGALTIPASVIEIGNEAFVSYYGLITVDGNNPNYTSFEGVLYNKNKSILIQCPSAKTGSCTFPVAVTEIGIGAFAGCDALTGTLTIPVSVTKIGESAFEDCTGFTGGITIPKSVETIGGWAFSGCSGLTELTLPSSLKTMDEKCFAGCSNLVKIFANATKPVDLTSSGKAFYNVDNYSCTLYVPAGSKTAYESAFVWQDFKNIVEVGNLMVSSSVTNIGATDGSVGTVNITSSLNWASSSNQTWLTVSPASGTGNGTITFTAKANQTSAIRTASVTITAPGETPKTILIQQAPLLPERIVVTFQPANASAKIDSIQAVNLTTNQIVRMAGSESLILSSTITNVISLPNNTGLEKLFPNPCSGSTTVRFSTIKSEEVSMGVFNASGQLCISKKQNLEAGLHSFLVQFPGQGIYFVHVQKSNGSLIFKVVSTETEKQTASLSYTASQQLSSVTNPSTQLKSASAEKILNYSYGNNIIYTVYSGKNTTVMTDKPTASKTYKLEFYACADKDGRNYKTVTIGDQIWMAENLAYLPKVGPSSSSSYSANYYYVSGYSGTSVSVAKSTNDYKKNGALYNWVAASNSCPVGWHLPSDEEWTTLEIFLQNNGYNYDGTVDNDNNRLTNNNIAKSLGSTSGWEITTKPGTPGNNPASNNSSGFSALPGGYFYQSLIKYGGFGAGGYGSWWSRTEDKDDSTSAWDRDLDQGDSFLDRVSWDKANGFSVRCVKD